MKSMRIAMAITSYHPVVGGAERQLAQLARLMADAGHELHVVTRRWPGLAAREDIEGIAVHRVGGGGPKQVAAARFVVEAAARLRRLRPDVIHSHSLFTPALAATLAKRMVGAPLLAKPMCGGEAGSIAQKRLGRRRLAMFGRRIDRFVAVSGEIEAELVELGLPPDRIRRIPNGVDVSRFRPAGDVAERAAIREGMGLPKGVLFVFAGRVATQKRLPSLLRQWARVRAAVPDATLLVAGANRQTSIGGADDIVTSELLAQDGVSLLGHVTEMPQLLRAGDVFVLPSDREGLSNAMLEACASGLPTVAAAIGGAEDFVEHGCNGYLYPVDDLDAMGNAMIELGRDAQARSVIGRAARATVAERYDIRRTAARLLEEYRDLLAGGQRAGRDY